MKDETNDEDTISTSVVTDAYLTFVESEFGPSQLNFSEDDHFLYEWFLVSSNFDDEDWCTDMPPKPTLIAGSVDGNWCFAWNDIEVKIPFNPIEVVGCDDPGQLIDYEVKHNLSPYYFKVAVDTSTNIISILAMSDGQQNSGTQ